jgi:hypothetical protein
MLPRALRLLSTGGNRAGFVVIQTQPDQMKEGKRMKFSWLRAAAVLLLLVAGLPLPSGAQSFQGQITGIIADAQGAVVPGATATLKNEATGETRTQVSGKTGSVAFPNLLVGTYTLTVEAPGFKKQEQKGIQVRSNTNVDVNLKLSLGGIEETMTVVGGADLVTTTSSQLEGATFNARQITDLPVYDPGLSGDVTNFAVLAPGVGTQPGGMAGQGGVIGGNRPRSNSFVIDGLDNNEPDVTGAVAQPIMDAVEEFQLLTNQFAAEFGHSTAGQFITVTKSGTNDFHGGLWEYSINRHFNSLDNLTRATAADDPNFDKPRFDRNRTGAQLGGPLVKDKLFFYSAYEFRNLNQAATAGSEILVPTAAGLGTLTSLSTTAGSGISPVALGILRDHVPTAGAQTATVPVINRANGQTIQIPVGAFAANTPNFFREHTAHLNIDANASQNHRVGLRLYYYKASQIDAGALPTDEFNSNLSFKTKRGTLSWVWTPRPDVINEFRAGYTHITKDYPVDLPPAPGTADVFANYALNDLGLEVGPNSDYPQTGGNGTTQISENLSYVRGAHTFKLGGEFRAITSDSQFLPRARAEYQYESLDQFLHDEIPSVLALRGVGKPTFIGDRPAMYGFIQDTWKVSPRLTLDLGVRYEFTGTAKDNEAQNLNALANVDIRNDKNAAGQVIFNTLTPAHQQLLLETFPDGTVTFKKPGADTNNFGPRLGFAWDINGDGKSSLRGGFGVAYDVFFGNLALLQLPPQLQVESSTDIACTLTPRPGWCNTATPSTNTIGFLATGGLGPTIDPTASEDVSVARENTTAYLPYPETSPKTVTWALSYQREVAHNFSVEARYVGTHSSDLPMQRRRNAGIPDPVQLPIFASEQDALSRNYAGAPTLAAHLAARTRLLGPYDFLGSVTSFDPVASSQYHGGSISLTRRFSGGFGFNLNYTLSRTEDDTENELFTSVLNPRRPDDFWDVKSNRGLSGMHKAHKAAASWQWEPFHGKGAFLKGWLLNGAFIFESGQALTIQSARDQNGDFDATGDRAFFNANGNDKIGTDTNFVCFSGGRSFVAASAAACGGNANVVGYVAQDPNAGWVRGREGAQEGVGLVKSKRGAFIGPGPIRLLNLSLYKNISFSKYNVRFGVTCTNCTNTPSYALGTASGIGATDAASANRAYATPGTPNFLDKSSFSGSMGSAPFQRIVQFEGKFSF